MYSNEEFEIVDRLIEAVEEGTDEAVRQYMLTLGSFHTGGMNNTTISLPNTSQSTTFFKFEVVPRSRVVLIIPRLASSHRRLCRLLEIHDNLSHEYTRLIRIIMYEVFVFAVNVFTRRSYDLRVGRYRHLISYAIPMTRTVDPGAVDGRKARVFRSIVRFIVNIVQDSYYRRSLEDTMLDTTHSTIFHLSEDDCRLNLLRDVMNVSCIHCHYHQDSDDVPSRPLFVIAAHMLYNYPLGIFREGTEQDEDFVLEVVRRMVNDDDDVTIATLQGKTFVDISRMSASRRVEWMVDVVENTHMRFANLLMIRIETMLVSHSDMMLMTGAGGHLVDWLYRLISVGIRSNRSSHACTNVVSYIRSLSR